MFGCSPIRCSTRAGRPVGFPKAIGFGGARFTFDAAEAVEAAKLVGAITAELARAGLADRVQMLELGQSVLLDSSR